MFGHKKTEPFIKMFTSLTFDEVLDKLDTLPDNSALPHDYAVQAMCALNTLYGDITVNKEEKDISYYSRHVLGDTIYTVQEFKDIIRQLQVTYTLATTDNPFDSARYILDKYTDMVPRYIARAIITNLSYHYKDRTSSFKKARIDVDNASMMYNTTKYGDFLHHAFNATIVTIINELEKEVYNTMPDFNQVPTVDDLRIKSAGDNIKWTVDAEKELVDFFNTKVDSMSTLFGEAILVRSEYLNAYNLLSLYPEYLTDKGYTVTKATRSRYVSGLHSPLTTEVLTITWDSNTQLIKAVLDSTK